MATKRTDNPQEYRQQLVELVRAGRSDDALAKEFDPSPQTIRNRVTRADRDDGKRGDGLTSHERDGLRRLPHSKCSRMPVEQINLRHKGYGYSRAYPF